MGKQHEGEMESIMGMEMVLREIERRKINAREVKAVLDEARTAGIKDIDLFRFLGERLLGDDDAHRLLKRIIAF